MGLCPSICGEALLLRDAPNPLRPCRRFQLSTFAKESGGRAARINCIPSEKHSLSANRAAQPQELNCNFKSNSLLFRKANSMENQIIQNYHADALQSFRNYKNMAEKAMAQISDEEFFSAIDNEANSIAVIIKHIAGNQISRWTDFLDSDGEKAERFRDGEFEMIGDTRESLMQLWDRGWQMLFNAVEPLTPEDFAKTVSIRGEPHTIAEALNRQLTHYAYHIGQIVLLAKHFRLGDWKTLSVPRNRSTEFNQFLADKQSEGVSKMNRMEAPTEFCESEQKKADS